MNRILVTGSAGFIGFHMCCRLLNEKNIVLGIDAMTDYYDVSLKKERNKILQQKKNYSFRQGDLQDFEFVKNQVINFQPNIIIHLAAQAEVRFSIERPRAYIDSNVIGTFNLLEVIKKIRCDHFLFGSTSSIYGKHSSRLFGENLKTDSQISFYAATKKSCEVITHTYSHLHKIPTTCIRFFTVYGP